MSIIVDCDSGTSAAPNTPCNRRNTTICGQRLRRAAHHGGDGEPDQAGDEQVFPAEPRRQPSHRRGHDRRGRDVGGQDPGDLVIGRRQAALHVGQRHVGDRLVQRLHQCRTDGAQRDDQPVRDPFLRDHGHKLTLAADVTANSAAKRLAPRSGSTSFRLPRRRAVRNDSGRMTTACDDIHDLEQVAPATVMPRIDVGDDTHARAQFRIPVLVLDLDPHRNALHHLDPVAGRILRRQH